MSDALYTTRLRWHHGRGVARLHGRSIELDRAPDLGGGDIEHLDYTPEVGVCDIRVRACDQVRAMTRQEIHAADRLLRSLFGG